MAHLHINQYPPEVVLYGGTGQAKVVRPIIEGYGAHVAAVVDDTPGLPAPFPDVPLLRGWQGLLQWLDGRDCSRVGFSVTIGNPNGRVRVQIAEDLKNIGLAPVTVVHPMAWIAENASIGVGCQILVAATICAEVQIGQHCIVNTRASVDHETVLEDGVEIAPGATLCGLVTVRRFAWVCAGATVLPRRTIGEDAIVGAGAVVLEDVAAGQMVVGVPAVYTKDVGRHA